MAMKAMHDLNVIPTECPLSGNSDHSTPNSFGLSQKNRAFCNGDMAFTQSRSVRGNFTYNSRVEGPQATGIPMRLQNPLLRSASYKACRVGSSTGSLRLTKSCTKLADLENLKKLIDDDNARGRSPPMDASSNMLLRALLTQKIGPRGEQSSSVLGTETAKVSAQAEEAQNPEETEASESSHSIDSVENLEIPTPTEIQKPNNEETTEARLSAETETHSQISTKPKRTTEIQNLSDTEEAEGRATPRRKGSRRNLMAPKRVRSLRKLITPTPKDAETNSDIEETNGRATPKRRGSRRNLMAPKRASSFRNLITPSPKDTQNLSDGEETEAKAAPKRSSSRRNLMSMRTSSFRNLMAPIQKDPQNPTDEEKEADEKMASKGVQDTSNSQIEARPSPKRTGSRRNLLSMRKNSFRNLITPELQDSTDDENETEGNMASTEMQDTSNQSEARLCAKRTGSRRNLMSMRRHSFRNLIPAHKVLTDSVDNEKETEGKVVSKEMQDTSSTEAEGQPAPKRAGSRRNLMSMRRHSFRNLMAPIQKESQNPMDEDNETEERVPLTRSASNATLRNPITRNGRSGTFPQASGQLKTRSGAKLEDMRSALSRTSSCGRNLSSHALQALSKISNKHHQEEQEFEQDPVFFGMIQHNPMAAEERANYDDLAVKKHIRKNPDALKAKYDFQVGGRGRLTVSRYPLPALVALGASLSVVKLAVKANPSALEASKDFHSTALHTACSFDTDMEVLRYIYNKHPPAIAETTKLVYLPLHNACQASTKETPMFEVIRFLVEQHPEGLMAINKLGDTPLRMAQRKGSMPKEVLRFLEVETERIFSKEENSETFSYVCERQSWGSGNKEMGEGLIEKVMLSLDCNEPIDGEPSEPFSVTDP